MPPPPFPSGSKPEGSKRKAAVDKESNRANTRKKRKTKGKGKARAQTEDLEGSSSDQQNDDMQGNLQQPRRSGRIRNLPEGVYHETDQDPGTDAAGEKQNIDKYLAGENDEPEHSTISSQNSSVAVSQNEIDSMDIDGLQVQNEPASTLEIEIEEDEKPKPMLQLKYQGFSIYGHCLCIVVEPWPPVRSMSRAPSVLSTTSRLRGRSAAPPDFGFTVESARARTPLFLPDDTDRTRSETLTPFQGHKNLPPVPLFHDTNDSDNSDLDEGGMMEFSQVLNATGGFRAGAADDDEDMEGAGAEFFGDADEAREF